MIQNKQKSNLIRRGLPHCRCSLLQLPEYVEFSCQDKAETLIRPNKQVSTTEFDEVSHFLRFCPAIGWNWSQLPSQQLPFTLIVCNEHLLPLDGPMTAWPARKALALAFKVELKFWGECLLAAWSQCTHTRHKTAFYSLSQTLSWASRVKASLSITTNLLQLLLPEVPLEQQRFFRDFASLLHHINSK